MTMTFSEDLLYRLQAVQASKNWTETFIATELGITAARWSNWKRRGAVAKDGYEAALFLLKEHEAGIITASHPDDPIPDDVVLIKESEVTFKNGSGHDLDYEIVEDSEPASYRLSWFQKERLNPKHCRRFKCSGESNEPFVFAGDTILVNLDETAVKNGKVYAFWHEGEGRRMKKLFQKTDGTLTLKSFNQDYPDEVISATESAEKITIIGRVRDKSGRGGL